MKAVINNIFFNYGEKKIFRDFSLSLEDKDRLPTVILGPSGCGKTTLLKLAAGLLHPEQGSINIEGDISMVFQEDRFLPWFTVLENISLPLEKKFGKKESRERALDFLRLVSLENEASSFPEKLSGGQRQRASIARAFAYPSQLLLMDEPFQSMDIPLRLELMELCLALLENEKRLVLAVTHDPREAVFIGSRVIILGQPPEGIIYDEKISLPKEDRGYGAAAAGVLEKLLISKLSFANAG